MKLKEAYEKKFEAQINLWNAQLDVLQAKAMKEDAKLKNQYEDEINSLRKKIGDVTSRLGEIKSAGSDAWEDLKNGTESAFGEMETSIKDALSRFRQN